MKKNRDFRVDGTKYSVVNNFNYIRGEQGLQGMKYRVMVFNTERNGWEYTSIWCSTIREAREIVEAC